MIGAYKIKTKNYFAEKYELFGERFQFVIKQRIARKTLKNGRQMI